MGCERSQILLLHDHCKLIIDMAKLRKCSTRKIHRMVYEHGLRGDAWEDEKPKQKQQEKAA